MQQQEINNIKTGDSDDEFDHTSPFRTKGGQAARLVGILEGKAYCLVVAIRNAKCHAIVEDLRAYKLDGQDHVDSLSLVNIDKWDEEGNIYMKPTEFVHAVAFDLEPMNIERSANPFHYDDISSGVPVACGWTAMYQGMDTPDRPQCLTHVDLVNGRSGQRIRVSLMQPKAKT